MPVGYPAVPVAVDREKARPDPAVPLCSTTGRWLLAFLAPGGKKLEGVRTLEKAREFMRTPEIAALVLLILQQRGHGTVST